MWYVRSFALFLNFTVTGSTSSLSSLSSELSLSSASVIEEATRKAEEIRQKTLAVIQRVSEVKQRAQEALSQSSTDSPALHLQAELARPARLELHDVPGAVLGKSGTTAGAVHGVGVAVVVPEAVDMPVPVLARELDHVAAAVATQPHALPCPNTPAHPDTSPAQARSSPAHPDTSPAQTRSSPTEPHTSPDEPHTSVAHPHTSSAELHTSSAELHTSSTEPDTSSTQPHTSSTEPNTSSTQPHTSSALPQNNPVQPDNTTDVPPIDETSETVDIFTPVPPVRVPSGSCPQDCGECSQCVSWSSQDSTVAPLTSSSAAAGRDSPSWLTDVYEYYIERVSVAEVGVTIVHTGNFSSAKLSSCCLSCLQRRAWREAPVGMSARWWSCALICVYVCLDNWPNYFLICCQFAKSLFLTLFLFSVNVSVPVCLAVCPANSMVICQFVVSVNAGPICTQPTPPYPLPLTTPT